MYSFVDFKRCQALENTKCYQNKVWVKSKTTWAVGIAAAVMQPVQSASERSWADSGRPVDNKGVP